MVYQVTFSITTRERFEKPPRLLRKSGWVPLRSYSFQPSEGPKTRRGCIDLGGKLMEVRWVGIPGLQVLSACEWEANVHDSRHGPARIRCVGKEIAAAFTANPLEVF